jgi:hypothetical protein
MSRTAAKKKTTKKATRKKASRHRYTAENADKYELYQKAVQSPETDVDFLTQTYETLVGRPPRHLREDFCGTALICCEWVTRGEDRTAEGYDLDPEPIEWGKQHNWGKVHKKGAEDRIRIFEEDARAPAQEGKQRALGEELGQDAPHSRTQAAANRDFTLPVGPASEQHAGDVGAGGAACA